MKFIRRQNVNQQSALDKKILIQPNGDIEFNPTTKVTVNGEFVTIGNQVAGPEVTNILYVTLDGDDANDGKGEGPRQAKRTLKSACAVAQEGTTIYVRSGEYYEDNPIRVPPKVSIIGDNLRRTILKPLNGTVKWNIVNLERTDGNVTITTDVEHGLEVGNRVRVICTSVPSELAPTPAPGASIDDECANIIEIPSTTTFVYRDYGENLASQAATGTVERGTDFFYVNSSVYIAQLVIKSLPAPAYCVNIDNDAIVDTSPYIQNCSNINGPWMNNGEEWFPFKTEQRNSAGVMVTGPRPLLDDELDPLYLDVYGINVRGGGGGMLIDGDRYSSVSPIQSMVADAFTQVAQGAVGFHITNFGYMQLVSCFNVFCEKAYYTTKGGYLSISNSVCDFGLYGFIADGYYPVPYDSGTVAQSYYSTIASVTITQEGSHYTLAPIVTFEPPNLAIPGSYAATGTAFIDEITGKLVTIQIDDPGYGYTFQPQIFLTGGGADPLLVQGQATANLAKNITITVNNLSNKPQVGSIVFLGNDPTGYYVSSTTNPNQSFVYNERKCRRDVEIILNAVLTDMVFGSNYSSVASGLAYLRSYSAKVTSEQKAQTIAGLTEARNIAVSLTVDAGAQTIITDNFNTVIDIFNNGLPSVPAISIPSSVTREAGFSEAKDILLANKLFIQDEITAWIAYNYSVLDYDKTTCARDIGLIIDALCYDLAFGSNFRSITAARSYYRAGAAVVTQQQKSATLGAFRYLKTICAARVEQYDSAALRINRNMDIIINVLENGIMEIPASVTPDPTGYDSGYKNARNLLIDNRDFIIAEVSAYLNINWTAIWTSLSPEQQQSCQRDTGYILDALQYDLTYGGNLETTIAGKAYYSFAVLQINPTEKAATLDAYSYMGSIIFDIVQNNDIVQLQGDVLQVTGTAGSFAAASDAQTLIQNVVNIIDTQTLPIASSPSITWTSQELQSAFTALNYSKEEFKTQVTNYIDNNNFIYNSATCRRDISYIIDAMAYDLAYGGNTQTSNAAAAYVEGSVISGQVEETLAAYKYWKTIVGNVIRNIPIATTPGNNTAQNTGISTGSPIPASGPAVEAQSLLQIVIDVVDHGPGYLPDPVTQPYFDTVGNGSYATIRESVLAQKLSIGDSVIDYLNNFYGGNIDISLFPAVQTVDGGVVARFHNVSTISTGGTALEYVGAGVTYNALPFFGGEPVPQYERVEINNGKCFTVTNDQVGNFRVGSIFRVNALTGEVTIDAENISLSGISSIGPFKRNGIFVGVALREVSDNTNLSSSIGPQDHNTVPTQYAVAQYVENRFLNKITPAAQTVASGTVTFDGSIAVNGGVISTTYSSFNLLNIAATTINFGGEAATINIGDATGTVYINGDLQVKGGDITTDKSTFNLVNTTATTVNFAGAASTVSIGTTTGTTTVNNSLQVNVNSTLGADTTAQNVYNGKFTANIPDNIGGAVEFKQSTNSYFKLDTSDSSELITFGTLPLVAFKNSTEALGTTTASVTFDGGVGIAKKLYVGGDLSVEGSTTLGNNNLVDTLSVWGITSIDVPDNTSTAFQVKENTQPYITATTINGSESVTIEQTPLFLVKNTTDNSLGTNASGAVQIDGGVGIAKNVTIGKGLQVAEDIAVNGGDITTNQTTFNIINTTATTVNAFGASTATNIGSTVSGTTTIGYDANVKHDLVVDGDVQVKGGDITTDQTTFNLLNSIALTVNAFGDATSLAIGNATVATVTLRPGTLVGSNTTQNVYNTVATTVNAFGAAGTLAIGASSGTLTIGNPTVVGTQTTVNLWNTTSTTVNAFGASTATNIGSTVSGTTTIGYDARIKNDLVVDGDVQIKGGDLTTDQTTFNLLNATTTTLNIGGAATTVNLGNSAGTVNIGELHLTTDLAVIYGGTGVGSFTTNGVLYGNNTSALQVTAASNPGSNATTSYGILTTDGTNVPVWTDVIDGGTY